MATGPPRQPVREGKRQEQEQRRHGHEQGLSVPAPSTTSPPSQAPRPWPMKKQLAKVETARPRASGAIWVALVCRVLCSM